MFKRHVCYVESADTFYMLIILKVITQVTTHFYQSTHKALQIQYRHTNVTFLGNSASGVIYFASNVFVRRRKYADITFCSSSSEIAAISFQLLVFSSSIVDGRV